MKPTSIVCLTIAICWAALMALGWYAVDQFSDLSVTKYVEVNVE